MRRLLPFAGILRRKAHDRRGTAAIEFALVAPVMITILIAVVDIGGALQQNIRLEAAARSALGYAHAYSGDTTGIRNIVINALSGWSDATVQNVAMTCDCATTSANVTTATAGTCGVACSGSAEQRVFLTVNVSRPYNGILYLQNRTLFGNVVMRVQ